jgi:hypothetical protein
LLWFGAQLVVKKIFIICHFITYIALYTILTPAKAISKAYQVKLIGLAERVFTLMEQENTIVNAENPKLKTSFNEKIALENITSL